MHRVALDRVAAAHLDGLGDTLGVFARARDRELGQRRRVNAFLRRTGGARGRRILLFLVRCKLHSPSASACPVDLWSAGDSMMQLCQID